MGWGRKIISETEQDIFYFGTSIHNSAKWNIETRVDNEVSHDLKNSSNLHDYFTYLYVTSNDPKVTLKLNLFNFKKINREYL